MEKEGRQVWRCPMSRRHWRDFGFSSHEMEATGKSGLEYEHSMIDI